MKKTAILLMIITILSKILGFVREITLSYFYGASYISDAYLIALTIPGSIFAFISTGISTGYIPMYSNILKNKGIKEAEKFTNNIINLLFIVSTIIILIVVIFTQPIVKIFASGFTGKTLDLAIRFTRVSIFSIYFIGLMYIFNSYLQLKNNFIAPAFNGFPFNMITIIIIALSAKINVAILSVGSVLAYAFQFLYLLPFIRAKKYRYQLIFDIRDEHLKKLLFLALPVIIGVSVNQINVIIDRTIASQIAIGGISALNYAQRLNGFIQGIFVVSIATVMYPAISKMAADHNIEGLKKSIIDGIASISLMVIPATFGAMIFAQPIVKLLFGRGAFNKEALSMTSIALFFYSIGMIGFGFREILSRAFYSMQDTKTPMMNAALSMVLNIILNLILSKILGIGGLALSTSISAIFSTILLFINLRKKVGPLGIKRFSITFIKIFISSLFMGIIAKSSYNRLLMMLEDNLSILISIGIGALVYAVIIYFMKIPEVDKMIQIIKGKFKKVKV
ncbi:murein biosynthesis integral membrane protein MurJ [Garciella nitratireducens]|uniref:Probable lipid II flippase MurJ n=1 Tax=Garciella nitratireducens DSM 15102 TaxID=1121911 RepID=A0A1T4PA26_9FIRM|nr:murein biosynthesis integral membrane protein MurJ [Garciella nitratireducens]SJZ88096.1 putative peptidoglycan lipid II flippase [Garciella nitratireducens DSM 15102]